jgi:hypothetical protein
VVGSIHGHVIRSQKGPSLQRLVHRVKHSFAQSLCSFPMTGTNANLEMSPRKKPESIDSNTLPSIPCSLLCPPRQADTRIPSSTAASPFPYQRHSDNASLGGIAGKQDTSSEVVVVGGGGGESSIFRDESCANAFSWHCICWKVLC